VDGERSGALSRYETPEREKPQGDMDMINSALQAIGLFLVTNIDDIIVLSLFFARGAGQRGITTKIIVGQYLGFGGILLASVAVTFGAGLFLPDEAIPYFGLIPLLLGVYAGWQVWRNGDDDDESLADRPISALAVAAVTFANGGDNIGVYVPVFLAVGTGALVAYCVVFLALVLVLVLAAKFVATRKPIAEVLERWEHILFPLVLIVLGLVILIEGGAFGL
jgi:cadmium resistance protein CadD (predicted permease)